MLDASDDCDDPRLYDIADQVADAEMTKNVYFSKYIIYQW